MKKLIGVSGFATSGKDSIAKYLIREHEYNRVAFADPVRDMLYALNPIVPTPYTDGSYSRVKDVVDSVGWDDAKVHCPEIRELLQRLGTDAGRKVLGENIWVDAAFVTADKSYKVVVFPDCRFENECQAIHERGGTVIRVTRPGITSVNDHISDKKLNSRYIDVELINDGTIQNLEDKIANLLKAL